MISDTKFELGFIDGELSLCDEVLTPDSSRFWPADDCAPGTNPPSFDKQPLRDWLEDQPWDKQPPPPPLPAAVVAATAARYVEAYERVCGRSLARLVRCLMMAGTERFSVLVEVRLREGIADPQGATIERALPALGLSGVSGVRAGKSFRFDIAAADDADALAQATVVADRLLANPVIEESAVTVRAEGGGRLMAVRVGVVNFPGTNCEHDAVLALERVGASADLVWHGDTSVSGYDALILPGGFAHGDYLRPGAIARFSPVMDAVGRFAAEGGPVVGICNGFQVLTEAGLLPGRPPEEPWAPLPLHHGDGPGGVVRLGAHRGGHRSEPSCAFRSITSRGTTPVTRRRWPASATRTGSSSATWTIQTGPWTGSPVSATGRAMSSGLMPHPERASDPLLRVGRRHRAARGPAGGRPPPSVRSLSRLSGAARARGGPRRAA